MRQYVEKDEGKFIPTNVGEAVNGYLVKYFPREVDYNFTAELEGELDDIANAKMVWTEMMQKFWKPFEKNLDIAEKTSERVKIETEKLGRKCPECKDGDLVIRIGRFGKFISCSRFPDCKHTEKFTEKLGMKCPECKGGDVIVKKTKRGKKFYGCSTYPKCKWASWRKPGQVEEN